MEPLSPKSMPRYNSPRGRDPAPKFSRARLPPLSPVAQAASIQRTESPELIFPMSPVLADAKETVTYYTPRRVLPTPQTKRTPEPILIDLVLRNAQTTRDVSNTNAKSKHLGARDTAATSKQKLRRQASSGGVTKRLMQFLNPTQPSVMATPTAVTVRRSSQADGLSEFVMEEHTTPPLSDRPVSKPVQIKRSKWDSDLQHLSYSSDSYDDDISSSLPKYPFDRTVNPNHEQRGSTDFATGLRSRPRLSIRNITSHTHLRSHHH